MPKRIIPQPDDTFNPREHINCIDALPRLLRGSDTIPPGAKIVYSALLMFVDWEGKSYPSIATLKSETGLSKAQVVRSINMLEGVGLIWRDHRFTEGRKTNNGYLFRKHICLDVSK